MKHFLFFLFVFPACCDSLHYNINWPSGLSLGEATLVSDHGGEKSSGRWNISLDIDASVPGFVVRDHYQSVASADLCGVQFDKNYTHGKHKTDEHLTFDQHANSVTRETVGGGKSDISVSPCARDPLAFIQFLRQELAQGRLPPQQAVIYGGPYQVRVEYTGAQSIKLGDQKVDSDRIVASIRGPSSDLSVEIFFSRDGARVPLLAKIPLALGTFSVELQR
jgi:hypothetical protein